MRFRHTCRDRLGFIVIKLCSMRGASPRSVAAGAVSARRDGSPACGALAGDPGKRWSLAGVAAVVVGRLAGGAGGGVAPAPWAAGAVSSRAPGA